ncbi:MAG: uridine kinase [Actinomycetota bacterium]|nr:uridine kinase [Actinomycetota bacterium]
MVAVDGGAAAGKSTLAAELIGRLPDCAVLHLDDLLDGWTGQFSFAERLHSQVLAPLAAGRPARYHRYDWIAGRFADWVTMAVPDTLIVEGVSTIDACGTLASIRIFLDATRADRQQRWILRDGPPQPEWSAWLDNEDRYFAEHPLPTDTVVVRL